MVTAALGFVLGLLIGLLGAGGGSGDAPSAATSTVTATVRERVEVREGSDSSEVAEEAAADESDAARRPSSKEIPGDGTFVVGEEVTPGTYRTEGPLKDGRSCYWARLMSTSGEAEDVIANQVSDGRTIVTIEPGDKAFETHYCKAWKKAGWPSADPCGARCVLSCWWSA